MNASEKVAGLVVGAVSGLMAAGLEAGTVELGTVVQLVGLFGAVAAIWRRLGEFETSTKEGFRRTDERDAQLMGALGELKAAHEKRTDQLAHMENELAALRVTVRHLEDRIESIRPAH